MSSVIRGSDNFDTSGIMTGSAKAWVNFNTATTTTITDSFNVSSLTDNGTGDTTINLTSAMSNATYTVALSCNRGQLYLKDSNVSGTDPTTSAFRVQATTTTGTAVDTERTFAQIHSN